jgi:hypothetical protein
MLDWVTCATILQELVLEKPVGVPVGVHRLLEYMIGKGFRATCHAQSHMESLHIVVVIGQLCHGLAGAVTARARPVRRVRVLSTTRKYEITKDMFCFGIARRSLRQEYACYIM